MLYIAVRRIKLARDVFVEAGQPVTGLKKGEITDLLTGGHIRPESEPEPDTKRRPRARAVRVQDPAPEPAPGPAGNADDAQEGDEGGLELPEDLNEQLTGK